MDSELKSIETRLDRQNSTIDNISKTLTEIQFLLTGSVLGKTDGIVQVVEKLSVTLDDWVTKFIHAEKWRLDQKAKQEEFKEDIKSRREREAQRLFDEKLKDKEISELKRSNTIKNWIAAAAAVGAIIKFIFERYQ